MLHLSSVIELVSFQKSPNESSSLISLKKQKGLGRSYLFVQPIRNIIPVEIGGGR